MPTSHMPHRKKEMRKVVGTVAQWFHESLSCPQSASGMSMRKMDRNRDVRRVYTSGMGLLKMRSLAPVRSTYRTHSAPPTVAASAGAEEGGDIMRLVGCGEGPMGGASRGLW
jgi:hypothetical protein